MGSKGRAHWGGRDWTLAVQADDPKVLADLKNNTYIPWCFDYLKGRGILKQINLSLHWAGPIPRISLAKNDRITQPEDAGLIGCIDASLKEFPPKHDRSEDVLEFNFIRSRK